MNELDDFYPCAGICQVDPESGECIGCGRPVFTPPTSDPALRAESANNEPSTADLTTA